MTATGAIGGSWYYMPREQVTNFKYVQPASDPAERFADAGALQDALRAAL